MDKVTVNKKSENVEEVDGITADLHSAAWREVVREAVHALLARLKAHALFILSLSFSVCGTPLFHAGFPLLEIDIFLFVSSDNGLRSLYSKVLPLFQGFFPLLAVEILSFTSLLFIPFFIFWRASFDILLPLFQGVRPLLIIANFFIISATI